MKIEVIIVGQNEDLTYSVKICGRSTYEVSSCDYLVAMSRARDLLHRNGGGTIVEKNKKNKTINTEDVE